jgi:hypothetical protein
MFVGEAREPNQEGGTLKVSRGCSFSRAQPFYEQAVSNLDP